MMSCEARATGWRQKCRWWCAANVAEIHLSWRVDSRPARGRHGRRLRLAPYNHVRQSCRRCVSATDDDDRAAVQRTVASCRSCSRRARTNMVNFLLTAARDDVGSIGSTLSNWIWRWYAATGDRVGDMATTSCDACCQSTVLRPANKWTASSEAAVHPSLCLSVSCLYLKSEQNRTPIGNPMLEVEHIGQCGRNEISEVDNT